MASLLLQIMTANAHFRGCYIEGATHVSRRNNTYRAIENKKSVILFAVSMCTGG